MKSTVPREKRVALVLGARNNFWLDQRVQRTARALSSGGYDVTAYTPLESKRDEWPLAGISARYITTPGGATALFRKIQLDYLLYNIPTALDMKRRRVDICHCNDFDTLSGAVLTKLLTLGKTRIVYDSHEDYPLLVAEGHGRLFAGLVAALEWAFTRLFVDLAITVNEIIEAKFRKWGIPSEVIYNCQDLLDEADTRVAAAPVDTGEFKVAYQGNMIRQRGYEQLIEAADILVHTRKLQDLKFIIIGKSAPDDLYDEALKRQIARKKLDAYFLFTGFVSYPEMMKMLAHADVGLILFQPTPNNVQGLPNKLFEDLAAGIPAIASNFPAMAKIITEEKCGLLVDPARPESIADAIEYLYRNRDARLQMAQNALQAAREKYNFTRQSEKLLKIYTQL